MKIWLNIVEKYPLFAGTTAATTNAAAVGFASFVKTAIPFLQFASLTIGIIIGLITLYGLIKKHLKNVK